MRQVFKDKEEQRWVLKEGKCKCIIRDKMRVEKLPENWTPQDCMCDALWEKTL